MSAVKPLRIMVVENHGDTLESLKLYLEDSGYVVHTAATVTQALSLLENSIANVLICDIGLPDGTGWELMAKLQPRQPLFAIAMSGFGMGADNERSRKAGFRYHLLKPFEAAELDKILAEAADEFGNS
jgi:CheY-like chemotaxis protein